MTPKQRQRQLKRMANARLSPVDLEKAIKDRMLRRKGIKLPKLKLKLSKDQVEKQRVWRMIFRNQPDIELHPPLSLKQRVIKAKLEREGIDYETAVKHLRENNSIPGKRPEAAEPTSKSEALRTQEGVWSKLDGFFEPVQERVFSVFPYYGSDWRWYHRLYALILGIVGNILLWTVVFVAAFILVQLWHVVQFFGWLAGY